ncbi:MAG: hypothetical protein AB3N11_12870 [Arenibacterium sp.]
MPSQDHRTLMYLQLDRWANPAPPRVPHDGYLRKEPSRNRRWRFAVRRLPRFFARSRRA